MDSNENVNRNIIPLWRCYKDSAKMGELAYSGQMVSLARFEHFNEFVEAWRFKKTIISAANLINAAMVSDNNTHPEVIRASEYLIECTDKCSPLVLDIAQALVSTTSAETNTFHKEIKSEFEKDAITLINELDTQEKKTKARIGLLRNQLREFCYNAIAYCELARCYSDLGLNEKAKFYMLCAVQLAPNNRYISRCAARFFVHFGEFDRARKVLNSNRNVGSDPWLLASEIAVASVMDRSSNSIKKGRQLALSNNFSPYSCSELCFAIGKEDFLAGKRKDWQKMFHQGLISPNDNSLAQAEYFAKDEPWFNINYSQYEAITNKNEADTRNSYNTGRYEEAFLSSVKWMQDYRFSHEPIAFAFNISCTFLKKYDFSIDLIKLWLNTKPQDYSMMNNLIYALGLSNRITEAEEYLHKINLENQLSENVENGICLLATKGMIEYRKGNIENGRDYYQLSINTAKKFHNKNLAAKARLNMIREEVKSVEDYDTSILKEMDLLNTGHDAETEELKKDIRKEVERKKSK